MTTTGIPIARVRRSKIRFTYEMIKSIVGIDSDLEIETMYNEPNRRILNMIVSSPRDQEREVDHEGALGIRVYDHGEGMEIIEQSLTTDQMIKNMRRIVQQWDEQQQSNQSQEESRQAMQELARQFRQGDD